MTLHSNDTEWLLIGGVIWLTEIILYMTRSKGDRIDLKVTVQINELNFQDSSRMFPGDLRKFQKGQECSKECQVLSEVFQGISEGLQGISGGSRRFHEILERSITVP